MSLIKVKRNGELNKKIFCAVFILHDLQHHKKANCKYAPFLKAKLEI